MRDQVPRLAAGAGLAQVLQLEERGAGIIVLPHSPTSSAVHRSTGSARRRPRWRAPRRGVDQLAALPPRPGGDHGDAAERPDEGKADDQDGDQGAGQRVIQFRTKKAAFLSRYRGHPEYGNRTAAGRVAAELAPLAGLQAGTGRTYIAEELRKLTDLAARTRSNGEGNDQPAG